MKFVKALAGLRETAASPHILDCAPSITEPVKKFIDQFTILVEHCKMSMTNGEPLPADALAAPIAEAARAQRLLKNMLNMISKSKR